MTKLAGAAAEGLICSQAGLPPQAARQEVPRRLQGEVQRRPDPLRAVHLRRGEPADRGDAEGGLDRPGKVPARAGEDRTINGATGKIEFDDKGDRKDAEITIFTMKDGKLAPVAIVKGGKTMDFAEFMKAMAAATAAPALRQRRPLRQRPPRCAAAEPKKEEAKDEAKK